MKKERALSLAKRWSQGQVCTLRHGEAQEYHELFISLLKRYGENCPLTLEQLCGMEGEPVWISPARPASAIPSRWMLFAGNQNGVYLFAPASGISQGYKSENYGKTWIAYRRPPERKGNA